MDLPNDVLRYHLFPLLNSNTRYLCSQVCRRYRRVFYQKGVKFMIHLSSMNGYLNILKWSKLQGAPKYALTFASGVLSGDLALVQWMRQNKYPWDERACTNAAKNGNLEMLQWLRSNRCPWNESCINAAAENGHLHIILWAKANGCHSSSKSMEAAAKSRDISIMKWLLDTKHAYEDKKIFCHAASCGNLTMLAWLCDNIPLAHYAKAHPEIVAEAAKHGHFEVVKWLVIKGFHYDSSLTTQAANRNDLMMLQWAVAQGAPWTVEVTRRSAYHGNLEMLQYAIENGCEWDSDVPLIASSHGHLEVLQYAVLHGCRWDMHGCLSVAQKYKFADVVDWIQSTDEYQIYHPTLSPTVEKVESLIY